MSKTVSRVYPELSVPAVLLGTVQGVLMTAAFVYIALKLGFGLPGSTVAAITGFAILRGALRRRSIVENNVNQTVASGINTASAGVVFTLPALLLLSVDDPSLGNFPIFPLLFSAVAGSLMGIVLIIPLRKQMLEIERLRFPSGTAVAALLRSPGEGAQQATLLLIGGVFAAIFTIVVNLGYIPEEADFSHALSLPLWFPIAFYASTANFGAGLLAGKGGLPMALGGVLAWWIISPIIVGLGWIEPSALLPAAQTDAWQAGELYSQMLRPLGIGLLIGGALAGVVTAFPAIKGAMSSLAVAARSAKESGADLDEVKPTYVYAGAVLSMVMLFIASYLASDDIGLGTAALIALVAGGWLVLAGIIVAQATGHTGISPLSGLALIAVTLMFFLTGGKVTAAIMIGVAVCIATNQCADMMDDLKSGHLVGSIPRQQQIAQLLTCWIGPFVAIGVMFMLWYAPGDGTPGFGPQSAACIEKTAECLIAPQAGALQGMIEALQSSDSAVEKYLAGALMGGGLAVFPIGGLGVVVGLAFYLPLSITLAFGVGNLVAWGLKRAFGEAWIGKKLVPMAAGLIIGEALTQLTWTLFRMMGV